MNALRGLALLLVFQAVGEALMHALALPFPGPVVGLMLLLGGLRWPSVRETVSQVADFLLAHLSLLFVPVGVGVIVHLQRDPGFSLPRIPLEGPDERFMGVREDLFSARGKPGCRDTGVQSW